jgi:hypothetical protein
MSVGQKKTEPITQLYLRPDQPPMYQVNHNENVAYTKNQLQVVKPDEVKPSAISNTNSVWIS